MQELTTEQLKFARSIGAVYINKLVEWGSTTREFYRKPRYAFMYGEWESGWGSKEYLDGSSDIIKIDFTPLDELDNGGQPAKGWDESIRGPQMSDTGGNRIWKYQMPVAEEFTMQLPVGAQIIRMDGENGYLWMWAVVDSDAPTEDRHFAAYKAGGTMPDDLSNHTFVGKAYIYIQQELMLYIFEVAK